ncbi:MAG: hypothetical protein K0Q50_3053 [Vampirovibrio sp.]|nr:hypothetical protein [Vampirovibrio sp.]
MGNRQRLELVPDHAEAHAIRRKDACMQANRGQHMLIAQYPLHSFQSRPEIAGNFRENGVSETDFGHNSGRSTHVTFPSWLILRAIKSLPWLDFLTRFTDEFLYPSDHIVHAGQPFGIIKTL